MTTGVLNMTFILSRLEFALKRYIYLAHAASALVISSLSACSIIQGGAPAISNTATSQGSFSSPGNVIPELGFPEQQNATITNSAIVSNDRFKAGDTAIIHVNGFEEFGGTYIVDQTGNIYMSYIGNINISNMTVPELQYKLTESYRTCCLVNPNISIERDAINYGKIVVDGAVNKPGVFDINEVIRLSEAIALAGGASGLANKKSVIVGREFDKERRVAAFNLDEIQLNGQHDPLIYQSDVIFVEDNKGRMVYNDFIKTVPLLSAVILGITR